MLHESYISPDIPVLGRQSADRNALCLTGHGYNTINLSLQFRRSEFTPVLGDERYLEELVLSDEDDMIVLRRIKLMRGISRLYRVSTCVESSCHVQCRPRSSATWDSQPLI